MSNKVIAFVAVAVLMLGMGALKAVRRPPPEPLFSLSVTDENGKHVDLRIGSDGKFALRAHQPRHDKQGKLAFAESPHAKAEVVEDQDDESDDDDSDSDSDE